MKTNILIENNLSKTLEQATYNNSYAVFIPWAKSIGFKTHAIRNQEQQLHSKLAEDFIANLGFLSNDIESECSIRGYLEDSGAVMLSLTNQEDNSQFKKISLPKSVPLKMSLEHVLVSRRSIRQFTGDSISLNYLATILRSGCGVTATNVVNLENGATTSMKLRSSPSAGGVYPNDIYIVALNVDGLEEGIYQFNPSEDCLIAIYNKSIMHKLMECFSISEDQISLKRAGFICLIC